MFDFSARLVLLAFLVPLEKLVMGKIVAASIVATPAATVVVVCAVFFGAALVVAAIVVLVFFVISGILSSFSWVSSSSHCLINYFVALFAVAAAVN